MRYKLVLTDLDGTLLTDEKTLLPSTERTIRKLVASGVLFATVSARNRSFTMSAISNIVDICAAKAYIEGGLIESINDEIIVDSHFSNEETCLLTEACLQADASYCLVTKDQAFARISSARSRDSLATGFRSFNGGYTEASVRDGLAESAYLIYIVGDNLTNVYGLATEMKGLRADLFQPPKSESQILVITTHQAEKGTALRKIADYFGVRLSETIAFGDSPINDCQFLKQAGRGVAVKNAHPEIVSLADDRTQNDNNEDGVGGYLRKFFGL